MAKVKMRSLRLQRKAQVSSYLVVMIKARWRMIKKKKLKLMLHLT